MPKRPVSLVSFVGIALGAIRRAPIGLRQRASAAPPYLPYMKGGAIEDCEMRTIDPETSTLLLIDFQARLVPAIFEGPAVVENARRLKEAAALLGVPVLATEQYPKGLGGTVPELAAGGPCEVVTKMSFDACRADGLSRRLPGAGDVVVAGCEAHVCVLQTVLGLLDSGRRVFVARDAIGSRRPESKEAAVARMERQGAEIVTTEMVVFEWLATAEHPRFREAMALVK